MIITYKDYNTGHPWYYLLGGKALKPKEILVKVKLSGYQGYMADDILQADKRSEPQRSEALRKIKAKVLCDLWRDISRYRECANQLRNYRLTNDPQYAGGICDDIHTAISLKHNHIYRFGAVVFKILCHSSKLYKKGMTYYDRNRI